MSNEQPYKLTQGTHTTVQTGRRVQLEPGAIFVPSDAELIAFRDRLEAVEDHSSNNEEGPHTEETNESKEESWPKHTGGGWYYLPNGEKVKGKEEAEALMDEQNA